MKPRSLLVLLVVVLGLGAFVWFYERDLPGSDEREARAKKVLPDVEAAEVSALVVEHDGTSVRLERVEPPAGEPAGGDGEDEDLPEPIAEASDAADAEWRIAAPERLAGARADASEVGALVSALTKLEKSRTLEDYDPAASGLRRPQARVTVERSGGEPVVLTLGRDVPASTEALLARSDRREVYVVDRAIARDLTREPGDWRDREVFPVGRSAIRRVSLRSGDGADGGGRRVVLARPDEQQRFRLSRPIADDADRDAVEQLLADLVRLRADRFVDDAGGRLDELGLAPPRGVVEVTAEGRPQPVAVEVGAPAPEAAGAGTYLRLGGQVIQASAGLAEAVARPVTAWQSKTLTSRELYRIDRLTAAGAAAGGELRLERSGGDWLRNGQRIAYSPVSDLLYAITQAAADELEPRAGAALGKPTLTLTLAESGDQGDGEGDGDGGKEAAAAAAGGEKGGEKEGDAAKTAGSDVISLYPARDGHVPATVSGRRFVLQLPTAAAGTISDALVKVRQAKPLPEPAAEALPDGIEIDTDTP